MFLNVVGFLIYLDFFWKNFIYKEMELVIEL